MHSLTFCEGTWGSHEHYATQAPFKGFCQGRHSWPTASNCYIFRSKPHSCPSCPGGSQPATSHPGVWSWAISNWHQTPLNWQLLLGLAIIAFLEPCWSLRSLPVLFPSQCFFTDESKASAASPQPLPSAPQNPIQSQRLSMSWYFILRVCVSHTSCHRDRIPNTNNTLKNGICVCTRVCACVYMYVCVSMRVCVCESVCMYVCVCECMHVCVSVRVCACVCM